MATATVGLGACDSNDMPEALEQSSANVLETNGDDLSAPGPPGPTPMCGTAPHKSSKISASNLSDTYTRPFACQSWTVHQATFTIPASHPYRKMWAFHEFDYADLPNAKAKCLASKVEFKTERQVNLGTGAIWLTVDSASGVPQFVDSTKACFWHNFNGNTASPTPATVIERISARAIRYTGSYDPVSTGARIQAQSIP
ncbi:MAG: hypothetical protein ABUS79_02090 [Pseudomonadota bacterium]